MRKPDLVAISIVLLAGIIIFFTILPSFSVYFGDDTPLGAHFITMTAKNFPFYLWDTYYYAGQPIVGLGISVFVVPAAMLDAGVNIVNSFYFSFLLFFLMIGVGLYLLAKQMAPKIVALSIPLIAWSSTTLWNTTIWGGSYDRAFALGYLYLGWAATYWYVSKGHTSIRDYLLMLGMWVVIMLANQHITYQFIMFTLPFMVFAYGNIKTGIKKFAGLLLPALGLTFFDWGRTVYYLFTTPDVAPNNVLTVYPISWLYTSGVEFQHTVGYLPVPIILISSAILVYMHFKKRLSLKPIQKSAIIALILPGIYYSIMGWVPPLWPFFPRIEATLDNVANLNALFLFAMPLLIGLLYQSFTGDARMEKTKIRAMAPQEKTGFTMISAIFIIIAFGNMAFVIPVLQPADWTPYANDLHTMTTQYGAVSNPEYRLSTSFKYLMSWVTYSNPNIESTGGRVPILDARSLYDSWYEDAVFDGNRNPSNLTFPLVEDIPQYQPYFAADSRNTATSLFWQDWYGAKVSLVSQYETPSQSQMEIYGLQPFFNVSSAADYGINVETVAASTSYTGTIAEQTNAKVIGFIGSTTDYNELLALLSYVGLGPTYVIPLQLNPSDLGKVQIDALLTDGTISIGQSELNYIRGINTVTTPASYINSLVNLGPTGSYELIQRLLPSMASTIQIMTAASGTSSTFPSLSIPSSTWNIASLSPYSNRTNTWITWLTPSNQNVFKLPLRLPTRDYYPESATLSNQLPFAMPLGDTKITMGLRSSYNATASLSFTTTNGMNTTAYGVPLIANETKNIAVNGDNFGAASTLVNKLSVEFSSGPIGSTDITFEIAQPQTLLTLTGNNYVYSLPNSVVDAPNLALELNGTTGGNMSVAVRDNNSSAEAINLPMDNGTTIVPLTLLSGKISTFDQIITSAPVSSISLISFNPQAQMPLTHTWTNGNNGIISGITGSFRGVVFKETYYSNWQFYGGANPLQAYYAGPGFMYIPLSVSNISSIRLSFNVYDDVTIASIALIAITAVTLSLWVIRSRQLSREPMVL